MALDCEIIATLPAKAQSVLFFWDSLPEQQRDEFEKIFGVTSQW